METNYQPTIKITVESHVMTKEEIKQSKIETKQRKKEYRQEIKQKRKKAAELKKNFKTMESCMIHPSNIKIGSLEKCIYSRMITESFIMGIGFGHIEEKYEPIEGEKVLIEVKPNSGLYVNLDDINSNKDLREIRKQIRENGIIVNGKIIECSFGKIRIDRRTIRQHPYFQENSIDTPVSIKELKKIVSESRK